MARTVEFILRLQIETQQAWKYFFSGREQRLLAAATGRNGTGAGFFYRCWEQQDRRIAQVMDYPCWWRMDRG